MRPHRPPIEEIRYTLSAHLLIFELSRTCIDAYSGRIFVKLDHGLLGLARVLSARLHPFLAPLLGRTLSHTTWISTYRRKIQMRRTILSLQAMVQVMTHSLHTEEMNVQGVDTTFSPLRGQWEIGIQLQRDRNAVGIDAASIKGARLTLNAASAHTDGNSAVVVGRLVTKHTAAP